MVYQNTWVGFQIQELENDSNTIEIKNLTNLIQTIIFVGGGSHLNPYLGIIWIFKHLMALESIFSK